MRWLKRGFRKVVKFLVLSAIVSIATLFALAQLLESSSSEYLWLIPALVVAFLAFKSLTLSTFSRTRYLNSQGYIVLRESNELEHRAIAREIIGRELYWNEVVHHINGRRDDNRLTNLCLMDHEKHEHFHSWIRWRKEKRGYYPSIKKQKRILREEYGGTLLTEPNHVRASWITESNLESQPSPKKVSNSLSPISPLEPFEQSISLTEDQKRMLFIDLRNERKRLSEVFKIPAYQVFVDKTLLEMAEHLPISKHAMLEIKDVSLEKYESYGAQFIAVIRKFKEDLEIEKRMRDRA